MSGINIIMTQLASRIALRGVWLSSNCCAEREACAWRGGRDGSASRQARERVRALLCRDNNALHKTVVRTTPLTTS